MVAQTESNSLLVFDSNTGIFKIPEWMENLKIDNTNISEVYFSSVMDLWIGFGDGSVVKVAKNGTTKESISLPFSEVITDFSESGSSSDILISSRNNIARRRQFSDVIETFDVELKCGIKSIVQEVLQSNEDIIWIGTYGDGIFAFDTRSDECSQLLPAVDSESDFRKSTVHDLSFHDESGLVLVASDQGILILEKGKVVEYFTTSNSILLNNEVISFSPDHSGGYWIGTYGGINRLVLSPFEFFNKDSNKELHSVVAIESIDEDNLLIASYDGLLIVNNDHGEVSKFSDSFPGVPRHGERIMSVLVDGSTIYIGYRNAGFEVINLQDSSSLIYDSHSLDGLQSDSISSFLKLSVDEVLIGTYGGGLTILNRSGEAYNILSSKNPGALPDNRVLMLFRTQDERIWIGTESGLGVFQTLSGQAYSPKFSTPGLEWPKQPLIWSMAEDSRFIWFGSLHHGLLRLDKSIRTGNPPFSELQQLQLDSPLSGLTVYAIEVGGDGDIWFSTNQGISKLAQDGSLFNFGQAHGLQETEFELGSSHKDAEGFLYFGGNHGYIRFHPKTVSILARPSDVMLTRVVVGDNITRSHGPRSNLNSIILNHNDRFITFEFSALDFTDPENTRYRHKLVGFDTDWIDIGNRGAATYTNLPAGDYVFRVQAVNSAGVWNYQGLSIDLEVRPAPWLTMWAFAAYFIAICGLVYMGLKIYRSQMLKKQQLQQAIELQQIADRFADSLQDQLEFQGKFTDSVHSYNKQLLYWVRFCTDTTVEWEPAVSELVHDRLQFRLGILELIQDSLYYRGEKLYSNLKTYTARLVNLAGASHAEVLSRLTTVNDIREELFPAEQAIPLAIIMAELFDNSLAHGFVNHPAACFVRFSVTVTADPTSGSDSVKFVYQDDGIGIPEGLAFDASETAGFTIMEHAAEALGCDLAIVGRGRNMVVAEFDIAWAS